MGADRLTMAFKLRASPSAIINLHPDLPQDIKSGLDPRCSKLLFISTWSALLASLPCALPLLITSMT